MMDLGSCKVRLVDRGDFSPVQGLQRKVVNETERRRPSHQYQAALTKATKDCCDDMMKTYCVAGKPPTGDNGASY